jgi:hypothetical protein
MERKRDTRWFAHTAINRKNSMTAESPLLKAATSGPFANDGHSAFEACPHCCTTSSRSLGVSASAWQISRHKIAFNLVSVRSCDNAPPPHHRLPERKAAASRS